jgi:mannose-6-phosphate isomerase-like protein (cupin superfamily)
MFKNHSEMNKKIQEKMRGGIGQVQMLEIFSKDELKGKCRLFNLFTLEPGCSIGSHVHGQEEEIYYVLSGIGTVDDNGTLKDIVPGDALKTGGGECHSITNTGTEPLVFIGVIFLFD